MDFFWKLSGWLFGGISAACAIVQTVRVEKYKKQINHNERIEAADKAVAINENSGKINNEHFNAQDKGVAIKQNHGDINIS